MQLPKYRSGLPGKGTEGVVRADIEGAWGGRQIVWQGAGEGNGIFDEARKAYSGHGVGYIG